MGDPAYIPEEGSEREPSVAIRWAGRLGAPAIGALVYAALPAEPAGPPEAGRRVAAVGIAMAILWMTEAMPLPATALIPIAVFPLVGVLPIEQATAPYAHRIVFLFLGGFMLALAMQRCGLHRRIALRVLLVVGMRPSRIVAGFMVATAVLSMWVSNTAAAVMMLPIGTSIVGLVADRTDPKARAAFGTALMLAVAYAASIGSVGTPIGTPPNLLLMGYLRDTHGIDIGFAQWMALGMPMVVVFLPVAWLVLTRLVHRLDTAEVPGGRDLVRSELDALGSPTRAEWTVFAVFCGAVGAWLLREPLAGWDWLVERAPWVANIDDAGIAVAAAVVLFMAPVHPRRGVFAMDWEVTKELPWGTLLLFGGGLSLAAAVQAGGLDIWIGTQAAGLSALPAPVLVTLTAAMVMGVSHLTSNTATAATFLPILGGVAVGIGADPLLLALPAALAATFAFMLPVATPPNAIVYSSGLVSPGQMARAGVWLNLLAVVLVSAATLLVAPAVLGLEL